MVLLRKGTRPDNSTTVARVPISIDFEYPASSQLSPTKILRRFVTPVAMVKPEKARRVEEMLMHAAKSGALGGKVTEGQFVQMLEQVRSKEFLRRFQEHWSNFNVSEGSHQ